MHADKHALVQTLRHYHRHILGPLFVEAADTIEELLQCCDGLERDNDQLTARLEKAIELPCKYGDMLYAPTRNFVSTFNVLSFSIDLRNKYNIWINWRLEDGIYGEFRNDGIWANEIGKTVFLTREEAEAALQQDQTEEVPCGDACEIGGNRGKADS